MAANHHKLGELIRRFHAQNAGEKKQFSVYVCVCVCVCVLTVAHLRGHSYENTPAKWGLFKLWGHFRVPTEKVFV